MLGVLYLAIALFWGSAVTSKVFPKIDEYTRKSFSGKSIKISSFFILIPTWLYVGVIPMTWCTYIVSYFMRDHGGMLIGNLASMILFAITGIVIYLMEASYHELPKFKKSHLRLSTVEWVFVAVVALFGYALFWKTFFIDNDQLYVGLSVFSDFAPHLGMIRSFSTGNNFPTSYSHFAGEDIKYHFMFQFLVGNLEYLGMRLDFAFNIPSLLGFMSSFALLYVLGSKITGKKAVGIVACAMFAFRSSPSLLKYLSELPKGESVWKALWDNTEFIGYTPNEDWGLWNVNVYCNQRHLAFTLGVLLLVITLFIPKLYTAIGRLRFEWDQKKEREAKEADRERRIDNTGSVLDLLEVSPLGETEAIENAVEGAIAAEKTNEKIKAADTVSEEEEEEEEEESEEGSGWFGKLADGAAFFVGHSLLSGSGWKVNNVKMAIAAGLLLGGLSFWNGAVTIATLLVLFIMAVVSDYRLDYVITAALTVALAVLQSTVFIKGSAVSTSFQYGFIAEQKTFFGALDYLGRLTGVVLVVVFVAFVIAKAQERVLIAAFSAPLVFAFYVSLTTDVTVNHKYIMIALMLLSIPAAFIIIALWENKKFLMRFSGVLLAVVLTITGFFEFVIVMNRNTKETDLIFNTKDPATKWIMDHSDAQDIFLTSNYALNRVVLGGAMLFDGWQYFAWSAGYNTELRDKQVKEMYEAETSEELIALTREHNIRYIIVDIANRESMDYEVREDVIENTFAYVYTDGDDRWRFTIYDTGMVLE